MSQRTQNISEISDPRPHCNTLAPPSEIALLEPTSKNVHSLTKHQCFLWGRHKHQQRQFLLFFWEIIITQGVSSSSNSSPYSSWTAQSLSLCRHHLLSLSWKGLSVFGRSIKKCGQTNQKHPTSKMLKKKEGHRRCMTEIIWLVPFEKKLPLIAF